MSIGQSRPKKSLVNGELGHLLLNKTLLPRKKNFLLLHIKLGYMKKFIKSLPIDGECFKYLAKKFPGFLETKWKEGIFLGLDIRRFLAGQGFANIMTDLQR